MTIFYERFEALCEEAGIKPQNPKMLEIMGVTSPAVSQWKNRDSIPKGDVLSRLSKHFDVSVDYLLGLTDVRLSGDNALSEHEQILIDTFRNASAENQFRIVQLCMNIKDEKGLSEIAG